MTEFQHDREPTISDQMVRCRVHMGISSTAGPGSSHETRASTNGRGFRFNPWES